VCTSLVSNYELWGNPEANPRAFNNPADILVVCHLSGDRYALEVILSYLRYSQEHKKADGVNILLLHCGVVEIYESSTVDGLYSLFDSRPRAFAYPWSLANLLACLGSGDALRMHFRRKRSDH